jgi:hypothetical protein
MSSLRYQIRMSSFRHKKPYQLSYTHFTESVCVVLQRTHDAAAGPLARLCCCSDVDDLRCCRVYLVQLNIYNVSFVIPKRIYELMPLTSRLDNILMKENTNTSFQYCTTNFELLICFFLYTQEVKNM